MIVTSQKMPLHNIHLAHVKCKIYFLSWHQTMYVKHRSVKIVVLMARAQISQTVGRKGHVK